MRFDRTGGREARYAVQIYAWNVEDTYYFHDFRAAKFLFNKCVERGYESGTSVSLYDFKNDIRKAFYKF